MIPPFVGADWVRTQCGPLVLADVRWYLDGRSGRAAYSEGHIPGAVFVDLDDVLAGEPAPGRGRHPLPDPADFARGMSSLGIGDNSTVVAYDDTGGVIAGRLVWMLRSTGHDAAVLDGGINAFSGDLETSTPVRPEARFTPRPWPADLLASPDDLAAAGTVLLDARDPDRYRGDHEPVDPQAGHIPGAHNLPCRANLDGNGALLAKDALRRRLERAGVTAGTPVISYCGSGVTACHNLLVMELCGLGPGRLYPGSWSQYSSLPGMPVETGDPT
jgi:thiosulfate/3-mercaptopyruvate sulfurtransferase